LIRATSGPPLARHAIPEPAKADAPLSALFRLSQCLEFLFILTKPEQNQQTHDS
jgi:hypothetical protein